MVAGLELRDDPAAIYRRKNRPRRRISSPTVAAARWALFELRLSEAVAVWLVSNAWLAAKSSGEDKDKTEAEKASDHLLEEFDKKAHQKNPPPEKKLPRRGL